MEPFHRKLKENPATESNVLSRITFWWTHHILKLGYERRLDNVDIYDVLPDDSSIKLANGLGREWEKESYRHRTGGQASLFRALLRRFGPSVLAVGLLFLLEECARIGQAIFLGLLLSYFESVSGIGWREAYLYATGWTLCYIMVVIFDNFAFHKSFYFGLKMRVAATSLIYRKLLRLSQFSLQETSMANVISLISVDTHKYDQSCLGINYIWISPVETVVIVVILWFYLDLGWTCLVGIAVIAILAPIQYFAGRYLSRLRKQMSHLAERRIRIMTEVLTGIRTIKVNCWETPFTNLVNAVRRSEWIYLRAMCHVRSLNSALYFSSGKMVMLGTFVAWMFFKSYVKASILFTTLALFEVLRASVGLLIPWGIRFFAEAIAATKRIEVFLLKEERNLLETSSQNSHDRPSLPDDVVISLEAYTSSWAKNAAAITLDSISLDVQKGQLLAVAGSPGSGKSSLLMGILNEVPRLGGFVRCKGKLSYVPQQSWIFTASVRDNILFGKELDRRIYNKVIHACALIQDMECFSQGDLTLIGDKGISLTTGQAVKICLARAVYHSADIYLIDDILNAVDKKTSTHIFTKCFCGILSTKTVIFVTNSVKFMKVADCVMLLKMGKVQGCGRYDDLKNQGIDFSEYAPEINAPTLDQNVAPTIEEEALADGVSIALLRNKLGIDRYSSEESLNSSVLDYKESSERKQLIEEDKEPFPVSWGAYGKYFSTGGGPLGATTFLILCILVQVSYVLTDWYLYVWVSEQSSESHPHNMNTTSETSTSASLTTSTSLYDASFVPNKDMYIYLAVCLAFVLLSFTRAIVFSTIAVSASRLFHAKLLTVVMRAPIGFFDRNPVGKLLSRFAKDTGYLDDPLPATLFDCVQFMSLVTCAILMAGVANPYLFLLITPLFVLFVYARCYFMATARDIKRIEMAARIPIHEHISNTLQGLWTIRAFQSEDKFVRFFDTYQDRHTAASYMYLAINRWFALRLDGLSVVLVAALSFASVLLKHFYSINAGLLGLALAYALNMMGLFQYSVRQSAEVENQLESVERISKYLGGQSEGETVTLLRPPPAWPQYGIITFEGSSLVGDNGTHFLRNIWCCVRAQEKIGVLGSSESSKKALIFALLRLIEPTGVVRIDGLKITDIGLYDLRSKMIVVSQDPMLFGGSIRRNLDPATKYPDVQLWKALADVGMKQKVEKLPGKLYAELAEFGQYFSIGERQLLCLARAVLTHTKILIREEPTAVVDRRTEMALTHIMRTAFQQCTVITIAHRISTVIDEDRIMVLHEGKLKEFDSAHVLLQNKNGLLYNAAHQLPANELAMLKRLAQDKHDNKPYVAPAHALGGVEVGAINTHNPTKFLPSFHSNRLSGVLTNLTGNRFSTNRF